jgi:hypothetical protein
MVLQSILDTLRMLGVCLSLPSRTRADIHRKTLDLMIEIHHVELGVIAFYNVFVIESRCNLALCTFALRHWKN